MNWREHIESRAEVMGGKPVIRGTRITVEILLEWLGAGWTEEEVLANYPTVAPEALKACFGFARELIAQRFYDIAPRAA